MVIILNSYAYICQVIVIFNQSADTDKQNEPENGPGFDTQSKHKKQEQEENRSHDDHQYLFPSIGTAWHIIQFILYLETVSETMVGCALHIHNGLD